VDSNGWLWFGEFKKGISFVLIPLRSVLIFVISKKVFAVV